MNRELWTLSSPSRLETNGIWNRIIKDILHTVIPIQSRDIPYPLHLTFILLDPL